MKDSIKSIVRSFLRNYTYTAKSGLARGLKLRGGKEFIPFIPVSMEEQFIMNLDLRGWTVYDIGAHIGVHTLFCAKAVGGGKVISYEPNPDSYKRLLYNIKVNHFSNVQAYNIALGKERTEETMVLPGSGPGGGTIDETIKGECLAHHDGKRTIKVEVDALDNQIMLYRLPKPDLIKIGVEGLELDVLLGAKATIEKSKPKLLVEMHGADEEKKIKNIKNVMDLLILHQYSIWHVEKEVEITHINYQIGKEGHIYCT